MEETADNKVTITLYRRRWFMLAIFSLEGFVTSLYQMSLASISENVLKFYNLGDSTWKVNLFAMSYMILNIPCALIISYIMSKRGLRFTVTLGATGHLIAGWVRFLGALKLSEPAELWFWIAFVGQAIAASVQPSLSYTVTAMSVNWFGANERTISTTISSFSNVLGAGAAFGMGIMVNPGATNLWLNLLIQAVFSTILWILVVIFFRSKPPTPPSVAATDQAEKKQESPYKDLWKLLSDIDYFMLLVTYGLGFGAVSAFIALINQITVPKGYNSIDASIFGLLTIVPGLLGSVVIGALADYTKRYKLLMWVCGIPLVLAELCFALVMLNNKSVVWFIFACAACTTIGVFGMAFVPLILELAVEVCYPIPANLSDSALGMTGTLCAAIFTFILDRLKGESGNMQAALWFCVGALVGAMFVFLFFFGEANRTKHEKAKQHLIVKKKKTEKQHLLEDDGNVAYS